MIEKIIFFSLKIYSNHPQLVWKPNRESLALDIIKMCMEILAHAISESKLEKLIEGGKKLVAETMVNIFQESIESTERYDIKVFYERLKEELNLQQGNALLKSVVHSYHEVKEILESKMAVYDVIY